MDEISFRIVDEISNGVNLLDYYREKKIKSFFNLFRDIEKRGYFDSPLYGFKNETEHIIGKVRNYIKGLVLINDIKKTSLSDEAFADVGEDEEWKNRKQKPLL